MDIRSVRIDALVEDPENERVHPAANLAAIRSSLQRFGQVEPLVVRVDSNTVIGGNGRLRVMRELGFKNVDVALFHGTDDEVSALRIALNRTGELADPTKLNESLAKLLEHEFDINLVGFSMPDFSAVAAEAHQLKVGPVHVDENVPEKKDRAESVTGDVYLLGPHRLVCGDCTDPDMWGSLRRDDSDPIGIVITDPPYGVSYVGKTADALTIKNDDLSEDELSVLIRTALGLARDQCRQGAAFYVFTPSGPLCPVFQAPMKEMGIWRQTLTWVKDAFVMGRSDYHHRHEPILYGWVPGAAHTWLGDRKQDTVLECPRPRANREHPTMKPVELLRRLLANSARAGDLVCDPFGGSGSTLIAAAHQGLSARLIEKDPQFCDVIRRRWTLWAIEAGLDPGPGRLD